MDRSIYSGIKELFGIVGTKGVSEAEIDGVRRVCGMIPYVLELYYREVGGDERVNHTQNTLILPGEYTWAKTESHLMIYAENQGVCFWGISKNDLHMDDPPVYVTFDNENLKEWELESSRLTDFLIAMAHVHAGFALPYASNDMYTISEAEANIIRNHFRKKCEPLMRWLNGGEESGVEFYGNHPCDSIVLLRNADYDLYYASGSKAYFDEMNELLSTLGEAY